MDKTLALAVIALTVSLSGMIFLSNTSLHPSNPPVTWGPIQTGTVRDTAIVKNVLEITVLEQSQAILFVNTSLGCNTFYHSGSPILYQVSSVDPSINTQRIRLVNGPSDCSVVQV